MSRVTVYVGVLLILLAVGLIILFVPVVPVSSSSGQFGIVSGNQSTTGSISYVLFKCGEVHSTSSSSLGGQTYSNSDQYKWVCGQG